MKLPQQSLCLLLPVVLIHYGALTYGKLVPTEPSKYQSDIDAASQLYDDYWNWNLKMFPEEATILGYHDSDNEVESHSFKTYEVKRKQYMKFLNRIHQMYPQIKNITDKLNLETLKWELEILIGSIDFKEHYFQIGQMKGSPTFLPFVIQNQKLDTVNDYHKYLTRLKAIKKQVKEDIELMRAGMLEGRTYHKISVKQVPGMIEQFLIDAKSTVFYKPFTNDKLPPTIPKRSKRKLQRKAVKIIKNHVQPAFRALHNFMIKEYSKTVRESIGLSNISDGRELYAFKLKKFTSTNYSAEELHHIGLKEVQRIDRELKKIIRQLGYNESMREFSNRLRNDLKFIFNDSETLLNSVRNALFNIIEPEISRVFWKLPKMQLKVQSLPGNGPGAAYVPGSLENNRPGVVLVSTRHFSKTPMYDLLTDCMHEGIPGHHLQTSYQQEMSATPKFRKNIVPRITDIYVGIGEGWALYAEYLGLELDIYKNLYDRYGHYSWENFRASRLVVDTGIHHYSWSKKKAMNFLFQHTAASQVEIEQEVDRYISWPGQACSYKIGELKIRSLRKKAMKELGPKFNIKDFHNAVLDCGNVPLNVLEWCIEEFIKITR